MNLGILLAMRKWFVLVGILGLSACAPVEPWNPQFITQPAPVLPSTPEVAAPLPASLTTRITAAPAGWTVIRVEYMFVADARHAIGPVTWAWDFDDGSGVVSTDRQRVFHTFQHLGHYRVSVTAQDSRHQPTSAFVWVQVTCQSIYDTTCDQ